MRKKTTSAHPFKAARKPLLPLTLTAGMTATTLAYAPAVEARRADYEQLAEAFVTMVTLENARLRNGLDVDGPDEVRHQRHLSQALESHLHALLDKLDFWDARTLRRFCAEMRLWADQLEWEMEERRRAKKRARLGERVQIIPGPATPPHLLKIVPAFGTITDQISREPMAITNDDDDVWIGLVRRTGANTGEIETLRGKRPFKFDEVDLVQFDWPSVESPDEGQRRAA